MKQLRNRQQKKINENGGNSGKYNKKQQLTAVCINGWAV